ncbi:MAG TPA: CopD family protein [Methylomirabilota bacterium]
MTPALAALFLHVLAVVVWIGGLIYQTHALLPAARRGDARPFAEAAVRARPATWAAVAIVVLTGFYNVTQLGSLERVMQTGAGLALAGKFTLVILAVALAAQRDFAHVPLLRAALASGGDPSDSLRAIARLDRTVLALALIVIWLGLLVSRTKLAQLA